MSAPSVSSLFPTSNRESGATVQVYALSAGYFSLPEEQFVYPCTVGARQTVPSLCFLVEHKSSTSGEITRIVFDLGLRRDLRRYAQPIQQHIKNRQPISTSHDVVESLRHGGLTPNDIDFVVYSHVHWDHIGEPLDFPRSRFVVGNGSLDLLAGKSTSLRGGHSFFEPELLDKTRTIQLSKPLVADADGGPALAIFGPWKPFAHFPAAIDMFQDGSVYIVDAPGHLDGHINLLLRTASGVYGPKWVYLGGDACHDRRIIRGEKEIGEWHDVHGRVCCIHADKTQAMETIDRMRTLEKEGVEVILAHDVEWENDEKNKHRFFGNAR